MPARGRQLFARSFTQRIFYTRRIGQELDLRTGMGYAVTGSFCQRGLFFSAIDWPPRLYRDLDLVGSRKELPCRFAYEPCSPVAEERQDKRFSPLHSRLDHESFFSMNVAPPPGSHIHLIAVCGVGMASLAGLLQAQGYRVTGSDQIVYPPMSTYLTEIGIEVLSGFKSEHISNRPALVIIGNAVSRGNPEAEAVLNQRIPYISFPQALGKFLIGTRQSLVVAGTHGKTTTTALAAWVLACAGLEPGFFVGGVPINFGSGWDPGKGNYVVI